MTDDRRARAAVSAAFAVQGLCFAGVLTQVPQLRDRFDFSDLQLSLILLIVPVVAGVGSVLAGLLAPRFGSAPVLRVAGLGVCLAVAAIGLADARGQLYAAVAAFGLAVGAVDATMNMQGVAVQRRYARSLLLSFHGWWSLAGIAGSLANAGTSEWGWSLGPAMGLIAAVAAVLAVAAGPFLVKGVERTGDPAGTPVGGRPPWRPIILIGSAVMVAFVCESSTSNWSAVYLDEALHASPGLVPLGLAGYLACQLLGRAMADRAVIRFGAPTVVTAGGLVAAAGLAVVAVAPGPAVAVAGFALAGLGLCVVVPLSFSAAGAIDPDGASIAIARVNLFNYGGFIVGAALIGVIAEGTNMRWAFAVPAVLALAIVALARAFRPATAPTKIAVAVTEPSVFFRFRYHDSDLDGPR